MNNYAFIDGQNLYLEIKENGWEISLKKFRKYLREKYKVQKAYYFIGKVPGKDTLYSHIMKSGFQIIYKPAVPDGKNQFKVIVMLI